VARVAAPRAGDVQQHFGAGEIGLDIDRPGGGIRPRRYTARIQHAGTAAGPRTCVTTASTSRMTQAR
jgi:hypothetical protein